MNAGNLVTVFAAVITTMTMATFGHAAPGTSSARETIAPHATSAYRVAVEAGVETTIDVRATRSASELACEIYDASGHILAKGKSAPEHCVVTFVPSGADDVVLRVENPGNVANDFLVTTR